METGKSLQAMIVPEEIAASDQFPILIVEDNIVSRKLLEKSLIVEGHKVVAVENGKEALKILEEAQKPSHTNKTLIMITRVGVDKWENYGNVFTEAEINEGLESAPP